MQNSILSQIKKVRSNYLIYGGKYFENDYINICQNNMDVALSWYWSKHIKFVYQNCIITSDMIDKQEISDKVYIRKYQVRFGSDNMRYKIAEQEERDTVMAQCYLYGNDETRNLIFSKLKNNMKNCISTILYCGTDNKHISVAKLYSRN